MRILIAGGTGFLGGAMVDAAATAGHEVTVLSRGVTGRALPAGTSVIRADRYADLGVIEGQIFDWVFDSCAYTPDAVHSLLDAVGASINRYVMISSISTYGTFTKPGLSEDDPVPAPSPEDYAVARSVAAEDRASAAAYGASYGPLKRACEIAATERLGDRGTLLRAGLLVGAGDYTDRLTWWVRRLDQATGDRRSIPVAAPPSRAVQMIDVRDVADFALRCCEKDLGGIWNVTGQPIALGALLDEIAASCGTQPDFRWVDERKILAAGVQPWTDMPLMAPAVPDFRHFLNVGTDKARSAGLRQRPLADTLARLLEWDRGRRDLPLHGGLSAKQEAALLI